MFSNYLNLNMKAASIAIKLGVASVVLPLLAFIIGMLGQYVIPGCNCDEGAGCHGCGPLNETLAFLILGGFVGALAAMIFVLPASLVLAGILNLLSRDKE